MDTPINQYWQIRLASVKEMLESNNFEVFLADNAAAAKKIVLEEIVPKAGAKSIAWGGSMTFTATGLYDALKKVKGMKVLDPYDKTLSREASIECRRQSLLVDLFITGTNAITEMGTLVNLDMIGNRVHGSGQKYRGPGQHDATGNENPLCQNFLLRGMRKQRPDMQQLGDHGKIVPERQDQGRTDQRGSGTLKDT
jgi:hypothetical protein